MPACARREADPLGWRLTERFDGRLERAGVSAARRFGGRARDRAAARAATVARDRLAGRRFLRAAARRACGPRAGAFALARQPARPRRCRSSRTGVGAYSRNRATATPVPRIDEPHEDREGLRASGRGSGSNEGSHAPGRSTAATYERDTPDYSTVRQAGLHSPARPVPALRPGAGRARARSRVGEQGLELVVEVVRAARRAGALKKLAVCAISPASPAPAAKSARRTRSSTSGAARAESLPVQVNCRRHARAEEALEVDEVPGRLPVLRARARSRCRRACARPRRRGSSAAPRPCCAASLSRCAGSASTSPSRLPSML